MNPLRNTFTPVSSNAYDLEAARYAKNKLALRPKDGVGGMKGRAARLINAIAPSGRWSSREKAYIVSPAQAAKFIAAFDRGADADLRVDRQGRLGYLVVRESRSLVDSL